MTDYELNKLVAIRLGWRLVVGKSFHTQEPAYIIVNPHGERFIEGPVGSDLWKALFDVMVGWCNADYRARQLLPWINNREAIEHGSPREIVMQFLMEDE